jgi:hypothetical protein
MVIDCRPDPEKALSSMRISRESDSKLIEDRFLQSKKHLKPRNSTLFGMVIDCRSDPEKILFSIRISRESDSNLIEDRLLQPGKLLEKHPEQRILTLFGMVIDCRPDPKKAHSLI